MASLVAMILVAISCAASACTVKCDLHRLSPSCHEEAHDGQGHTMADMGATVSLPSAAQIAPPHAVTAPCGQHVCVERPAWITADSASAIQLNLLQQALAITLIEWPAVRSLPSRLSDPPPLRTSSLVSLHTVLRV